MKQKTIIQLWGAEDGGKSSTIKILNEELHKLYVNPSHTYSLPIGGGDIHLYCNYLGYKIAIESAGDTLKGKYLLKSHLDTFVKKDCDLIICASRVRNDVSRYIKSLAKTNDYRLIKVTNYRGTQPPFVQNDLNKASAIHLADLVNQVLTGLI